MSEKTTKPKKTTRTASPDRRWAEKSERQAVRTEAGVHYDRAVKPAQIVSK